MIGKQQQINIDTHVLLHCIQFPVILLDMDYSILDINEPALQIYSWQHKNVINKNIFMLCQKINANSPITTEELGAALLHPNTPIRCNCNKNSRTFLEWMAFCYEDISTNKKIFVLSAQTPSHEFIDLFREKNYEDLITNSMLSLINYITIATKQGLTHEETFNFKHLSNDINASLRDIVALLPGEIYWEDRRLTYLGCNDYTAEIVGIDSQKDLVGKDDLFIKNNMKDNYPADAYNLWRNTAHTVMEKKNRFDKYKRFIVLSSRYRRNHSIPNK